jgi:hypothetical protein
MDQAVSKVQVARMLGVSLNQVHMWYVRRANNGFPQALRIEERRPGMPAPVFDPEKVLAWHSTYVPRKGGRPPRVKKAA